VYITAYFVLFLLLHNTRCRSTELRSLHSAENIRTVVWQGEWLDLAAAEREGRLHWGEDAAGAAQSGAQDVKAAEQLRQGQFGTAVQHTSSTTVPPSATEQRTHCLHLGLSPLSHAGMVACRLGRWRDAV
jgi:hypothetical protein